MNANDFYAALTAQGMEMFCGVPDSCLKEFCACVTDNALATRNIIAANEGNALAIATGHYLATGKPAVVYMQNSGLGNIVNPLLSISDEEVYNIPSLLIIGWRGMPGEKDEPQHIKQGKLTLPLLDTMGIRYEILEDLTQVATAATYMAETKKPFAFVVKKGTFEPYKRVIANEVSIPRASASRVSDALAGVQSTLAREEAIQTVLSLLRPSDIVISTTGMISREVYENRVSHEKDFLTVGGMGHASSIAFGVALNKPDRTVYCLDGDGAFLMHMGAAPVIASRQLPNLKHIVFNNEAHDSVGGQPTVMGDVNLPALVKACGYRMTFQASTTDDIRVAWSAFATCNAPCLLEIKVKTGARKDLGRPNESPQENKTLFMNFLANN